MKESKGRGRPKIDAEARKKEILKATVKLFSKRGYSLTNIQDVADHIGVAKGTLYLYFKTKEELFLASVEYAIENFAEYIDKAVKSADSPLEKIRAFIAAFISFVEKKQPLAAMIVQEGAEFKTHAENTYQRMYKENAPHLKKIISDGVAGGVFRDLNPDEASEILVNLLSGMMYSLLLGRTRKYSKKSIEGTTEFLLNGMLKNR